MDWKEQLIAEADDKCLAEKIAKAIICLFHNDLFLFQADANERSISHHLAVYLKRVWPNWDVDCEYNRDRHDTKSVNLSGNLNDGDGTNGSRVYPDVIVHKRGCDDNLLVIEIKKTTSDRSDAKDIAKLKAYRLQLNYRSGLFLRFRAGQSTADVESFRWF